MKTLKSILLAVVLLSISTYAQDKGNEYPFPVGGVEAIMKNVVYPEAAKSEGIQGKVIIKAVIDETGKVVTAESVNDGNQLLINAAIAAVKITKFIPAVKDGKKVKAEVAIPVMFKLSDKIK